MARNRRRQSDLLLGHIELSTKQKDFFEKIINPNTKLVFLNGVAGTSKTLISLYSALQLYNYDNNLKIRYIRSVVESADKSLGFLKGSLEQKFDPYLLPLYDKLDELLNENEKAILDSKRVIECMPVNFLRGSDWKNIIAIVDEAQNLSEKEIVTICTRLNNNSKIIFCGDNMQSDIRNSGYKKFCDLFDDEESRNNGIQVLSFGPEDVRRDPIVKYVLKKLEKK